MVKESKKLGKVIEELKDDGVKAEVVEQSALLAKYDSPPVEEPEVKKEKKGEKREIIIHWTGQAGYMTEDNDFVPLN